MERTISIDEKIKRAEEIYRRKREGIRVPSSTVNAKRDFKILKKIGLQLLFCIFIYSVFYTIRNKEYVFSDSVINKSKEVLSYNVDLKALYENGKNYINGALKEDDINEEDINNTSDNSIIENSLIEDTVAVSEVNEEYKEPEPVVESIPQTQEEIDANEIKANYSLVLPVSGEVTSRFGGREEEPPIVSAFHAGIDIAANTGTVIVASMAGTVIKAEEDEDLGKYVMILNDDVLTLYAHCNALYVNVGDNVTLGQGIAEVGSTGRSTGAHLHFQVEKSNRLVNPDLVFNF